MMIAESELATHGFQTLAAAVRRRTGVDLSAYREAQLTRRINSFLRRMGLSDLSSLARAIAADTDVARRFIDELGINVTEFMRNRPLFEYLRNLLVERNLNRPIMRLWSAGCSIGCEPYSLAMIMHQIAPKGGWRILATDIDEAALKQAEEAIYTDAQVDSLTSEELKRYFVRVDCGWQVCEELRRRVQFRRLDLLRDPYPPNRDVILCRNVIIYFQPEAKQRVLQSLSNALADDGILFLGGSETIQSPESIGLEQIRPFFYRKAQRSGSSVSEESGDRISPRKLTGQPKLVRSRR